MHTRILIWLLASVLFVGAIKIAHPEQTLTCPLGETLTFSMPDPPATAISASLHISHGVGEFAFDPSSVVCQWKPGEPGEYRVSIVYELQGGAELCARTVYCDVENASSVPPVVINSPWRHTGQDGPIAFVSPPVDLPTYQGSSYPCNGAENASPIYATQSDIAAAPSYPQYARPSFPVPTYQQPYYSARFVIRRDVTHDRHENRPKAMPIGRRG